MSTNKQTYLEDRLESEINSEENLQNIHIPKRTNRFEKKFGNRLYKSGGF